MGGIILSYQEIGLDYLEQVFSRFRLLWTSTALPLGFLSGPGFLGEFLGDS